MTFPPQVALFKSVRTLLILMRCCLLRIWTSSGMTGHLPHCVTFSVLLKFSVLLAGSAALSSMSETSKLSVTSIVEMMDKGVMLGLSPITSTSS